MEINALFWLLLPIAAFSGWLTAQQRFKQTDKNAPLNRQQLPADYFKGINYLLNEQTDKALDTFIRLLDDEQESVETHLALGAFFRRRGEVNRAIQIHQHLTLNQQLSAEQRQLALLALGQDYQHAGLLDRAEALFLELSKTGSHQVFACQQLRAIYEQEHDWEQAINTSQKLMGNNDSQLNAIIAHYYCELAEQACHQKDYRKTDEILQQALASDATCVRASFIEGNLALRQGQPKQAINAFRRVEHQNARYISEVLPALQSSYQQLGKMSEFADYLRWVISHYGGITPLLLLCEYLEQTEGYDTAIQVMVEQLQRQPSLKGLHQLISLCLRKPSKFASDKLTIFKTVTHQLLINKRAYLCHECGFSSQTLYWLCPSCKQWNTIEPIQGENGMV